MFVLIRVKIQDQESKVCTTAGQGTTSPSPIRDEWKKREEREALLENSQEQAPITRPIQTPT